MDVVQNPLCYNLIHWKNRYVILISEWDGYLPNEAKQNVWGKALYISGTRDEAEEHGFDYRTSDMGTIIDLKTITINGTSTVNTDVKMSTSLSKIAECYPLSNELWPTLVGFSKAQVEKTLFPEKISQKCHNAPYPLARIASQVASILNVQISAIRLMGSHLLGVSRCNSFDVDLEVLCTPENTDRLRKIGRAHV